MILWVCLCMRVHVCVWERVSLRVKMHTCVCLRCLPLSVLSTLSSETEPRQSLPYLLEWLAGKPPGSSCSTCGLSGEHAQTCLAFTGVLGDQTQVLTLIQKTLWSLTQPPWPSLSVYIFFFLNHKTTEVMRTCLISNDHWRLIVEKEKKTRRGFQSGKRTLYTGLDFPADCWWDVWELWGLVLFWLSWWSKGSCFSRGSTAVMQVSCVPSAWDVPVSHNLSSFLDCFWGSSSHSC